MTKLLSGPYRRITVEEARKIPAGQVEWAEGCGLVAYDAEAQRQWDLATNKKATHD